MELGALAAMAELGALAAMADGLRDLGLGPLVPAPTTGTLLPPPKKKFPGEVRGYQEPSGAKQTGQYKTRQESPPGPDRQDRTAHRNRKPSWAGLEAEASSGHDRVRGPHRVPQQPLPLRRQGGRRLEWPLWPQQEEPPAPDESLWTRHDKIVKMFLWARHDKHTALLAMLWTGSTGLGFAAASGHESAPIRRA